MTDGEYPSVKYYHYDREGVGSCAFLSLRERLDTKQGFDQVKASQSFLGCDCQVVSLCVPPFS